MSQSNVQMSIRKLSAKVRKMTFANCLQIWENFSCKVLYKNFQEENFYWLALMNFSKIFSRMTYILHYLVLWACRLLKVQSSKIKLRMRSHFKKDLLKVNHLTIMWYKYMYNTRVLMIRVWMLFSFAHSLNFHWKYSKFVR